MIDAKYGAKQLSEKRKNDTVNEAVRFVIMSSIVLALPVCARNEHAHD